MQVCARVLFCEQLRQFYVMQYSTEIFVIVSFNSLFFQPFTHGLRVTPELLVCCCEFSIVEKLDARDAIHAVPLANGQSVAAVKLG